ncbi:MAG: hypothetical protein ACKOJF_20915, partial [Planctomycetaceae bacterium]
QHLKRTQDANAFLNLAGIGKKGRVRLDIGEAYFPLIARPTGMQDHGEFHRSPEQLKGVPTLNVENIFTVGHGCRAVVVLGEPGAGKSSVARRMAWEYATACLNPDSMIGTPTVAAAKTEGGAVGPHRPVLVKLNQLDLSTLKLADRPAARRRVRDCLRRELVRVIDPQWKGRATGSPADLLGPGPVLWIFDGLDEVLNLTHRRLV